MIELLGMWANIVCRPGDRTQTNEYQGVPEMSASITTSKRYLALAVALLALAVGFFAFTASAQAQTLQLAGGYTQLTTDPGTTKALVGARILPLPILPSWVIPTTSNGQLALRYRFYITGGQIDGQTLGGEILHSGGLKFANLKNGKSLAVKRFTIDTNAKQLTAYIPALGARAAILDLDLSGVQVSAGKVYTKVGPVPAKLTPAAAGALNASLGTNLFTPGLALGTAYVYARFAN